MSTDPYKTLGVGKDADLTAIKAAYRKLVLKCHPDKVQDPTLKAAKQNEFQRVQQAYEILGDEKRRKEYDEDAKLKKLREEVSRGMARSTATPRSSPKTYNEPHIRTAEPPPSFKASPAQTSPFSPYTSASHQFSQSREHDIPFRTKATYDEDHRARRAASYEKPRDDVRDERRRRKDDDEHLAYEWLHDKERDRERDRDLDRERVRDREREGERDRRGRSDREKDDRKEKTKRDMEKRERDRDRARRQDQQEKSRARKPIYPEGPGDSDEEYRRISKKSSSPGISASASAGGKKRGEAARRDKSSRREEATNVDYSDKTTSDKMKYAAEYMVRKRGINTGLSNLADNLNLSDPDQTWHTSADPSRQRRASQDDKKPRNRVILDDGEVQNYNTSINFRPPRLTKSNTSPAGALHMSDSSARMPNLSRATTMDYTRLPPPAAPSAPFAEPGRHPPNSDRHRRGSFEGHDEGYRPRRSSGQPRVLQQSFDDASPTPRTPKTPFHRLPDDIPFLHSLSPGTSRKAGLGKIRYSKTDFSPEHVYQTKRFSSDDISYSNVPHIRSSNFVNI